MGSSKENPTSGWRRGRASYSSCVQADDGKNRIEPQIEQAGAPRLLSGRRSGKSAFMVETLSAFLALREGQP